MQPVANFIGFAVFAGLMAWVFHAFSFRWRGLARAYAAPWPARPVAFKRLESIILLGGGPLWMNHIVSLRVTDQAFAVRLAPFGLFQPAAVFPFAELKAEPVDWHLNSESWALTATQAPGYRMIVPRHVLDWIMDHAPSWRPKL